MQNKINKRTAPIAVMIGIGISLLFATALTAVITTLIANRTVNMEMLKYSMPVVHAVSVYVGCIISKIMCSQKKLITESICGSGYFLILIIMNLLFSESGMYGIIPALIGVATGIICAGFTWNPTYNRGLKGKRKVRFR